MPAALTDQQVATAADFLDAAAAAGGALPTIPEDCRPETAADGQRIFAARWAKTGEPAVAWKAAVLEGAMVLAPFFEGMVFDSPAQIAGSVFGRCVIEGEVAFRINTDLAPREGGYSDDEVHAAVASAHAVIEAPNMRFAEVPPGMPSMAADGVGAQALVMGPEISDWQDRDLRAVEVDVLMDGESVAGGRDERPDPLEILTATVNEIGARGMTVEAGQVITTGAAAIYQPAAAGQTATVRFPGIGDVVLELT